MNRYIFRPMLGPASAHPIGSPEWAECMGNEFDYRAERAEQDGVVSLVPVIRKIIETKPWTAWEPCDGDPEKFFLLCSGRTYAQLWLLIDTWIEGHGLPSSLTAAQ